MSSKADEKNWFVIASDGDIDYTDIYGPYESKTAAEAACPVDNDDYSYRVITPQDPISLPQDN